MEGTNPSDEARPAEADSPEAVDLPEEEPKPHEPRMIELDGLYFPVCDPHYFSRRAGIIDPEIARQELAKHVAQDPRIFLYANSRKGWQYRRKGSHI
ncbi:hypothetical protein HY346_02295 [Candidatus Microgenomates bacterium]|nr:hypothetical protein [Candidatus Microgenomates bacterium]